MPSGTSAGVTKFIKLKDAPSSYAGQAGKLPYVKTTEDGLEFLAQKAVGFTSKARAYLGTTVQSIPSATVTEVTLNTEDWDVDGEFDNVTNYRFTATKAGYYLACAAITYADLPDGCGYQCRIHKNGSCEIYGEYRIGSAASCVAAISGIIYLAVGDYLELFAYHTAGVAKNILASRIQTWMAIHRLS
jgi:hypothetical protein